jgi:protein-tyrosine phosphatase
VREDFGILFVCTANIVRSPMAAVVARAMLQSSPCPIRVSSAGTHARVGSPMAPHALATLRSLRLDGTGHRAQALNSTLINASDLILTMETIHRGSVVTLEPSAVHKTFTLHELAHLAERSDPPLPADTVERARMVVNSVSARRGTPTRRKPRSLEIVDPYGGPREGYQECVESIGDSLSRVLGALLGAR